MEERDIVRHEEAVCSLLCGEGIVYPPRETDEGCPGGKPTPMLVKSEAFGVLFSEYILYTFLYARMGIPVRLKSNSGGGKLNLMEGAFRGDQRNCFCSQTVVPCVSPASLWSIVPRGPSGSQRERMCMRTCSLRTRMKSP